MGQGRDHHDEVSQGAITAARQPGLTAEGFETANGPPWCHQRTREGGADRVDAVGVRRGRGANAPLPRRTASQGWAELTCRARPRPPVARLTS